MANETPTPAAPAKAPATGTTWARAGSVTAASIAGPQLLQPVVHQLNGVAMAGYPAWKAGFDSALAQNNFEWSMAIIVAGLAAGAFAYFLRGRAGLEAQFNGGNQA